MIIVKYRIVGFIHWFSIVDPPLICFEFDRVQSVNTLLGLINRNNTRRSEAGLNIVTRYALPSDTTEHVYKCCLSKGLLCTSFVHEIIELLFILDLQRGETGNI